MSCCYRCGARHNIKCCKICHKYMCPRCRGNWIQRSMDAAYERIYGYSQDWFPEGMC